MPEYLTPGVYIEEMDIGAKPIEGVSTSTAAFLGQTERGPLEPRLVTSFEEYKRVYGGYLDYSYLTYAVEGFFSNGGKRCYIARVMGSTNKQEASLICDQAIRIKAKEGMEKKKIRITISDPGSSMKGDLPSFDLLVYNQDEMDKQELFPGINTKEEDLNYCETRVKSKYVKLVVKDKKDGTVKPNFYEGPLKTYQADGIAISAIDDMKDKNIYIKISDPVPSTNDSTSFDLIVYRLNTLDEIDKREPFPKINTNEKDLNYCETRVISQYVTLKVVADTKDGSIRPASQTMVPLKNVGGSEYAILSSPETLTIKSISPGIWGNKIGVKLDKGSLHTKDKPLYKMFVAYSDKAVTDKDVVEIFDNFSLDQNSGNSYKKIVNGISNFVTLEFSGSGAPKSFESFKPLENGGESLSKEGKPSVVLENFKDALTALRAIDGISIVCTPDEVTIDSLTGEVIDHCDGLKDRFAVISTKDALLPGKVEKPNKDSKYAALYYPWICITDPLSGTPKLIPPCGHVAGVYARVDVERGVHKAPANEVIRGAIGLERNISSEDQSSLNPKGINCIRSFPGRGIRIWGARTISSDPSWKYVNVRRLFIYLEKSIEAATQWAVFEPNDEKLWARMRQTVNQFLTTVWRSGALMGTTSEEAFFVKCDRTTMTQDDIDNGRMIMMIGVAPVKPAEFVIFRIAQVAKGSEISE